MPEGGIQAGREIASNSSPVTAAVTTADICAIGIMEGARLGGYRIPVDLSVIGYDNLTLCQYTLPKLTSVSQNIPQKAKLATSLLLEKIRTGSVSSSCQSALDVEIVERCRLRAGSNSEWNNCFTDTIVSCKRYYPG